MSTSIEKNIQRIKRFSLSCTLNDNGTVRHFHNGHEYIEIGGIKWATCNVGAEKPTDYGLYFQWGDTQGYTAEQVGSGEGKKYFGWADYKYNSHANLIKYNNSDKKALLDQSDDAVTFNMGIGWRMPTEAELRLLQYSTTSKWVTNYQGSGISGLVCTDKTNSSKTLFFPANGFCADGSVIYVGSRSNCWSSSLGSLGTSYARILYFSNDNVLWDSYGNRSYGLAMRAVVDEQK